MNEQAQLQFEELKRKLGQLESYILSAKKSLEKLEKEYLKPDFTQIDGVVGWYDGKCMITETGEKYEVPANYSAKSKIAYGDTLKLIEEGEKKLFKQISKVPREKVEGILTKKEGEWYLLTDRGSYKVLDTAADFQGAELNSQATAFVPSEKPDAPFAALDYVQGFGKNTNKAKPSVSEEEKPKQVIVEPAVEVKKPAVQASASDGKKAKSVPERKPRPQTKSPQERKPSQSTQKAPVRTQKPSQPKRDEPQKQSLEKIDKTEKIEKEEKTEKTAPVAKSSLSDDDLV